MLPVERFDAAIVGGGIIGLACAWRARQRGVSVCVLERGEPGCGATRAAAGVLAPDPETPGFTALAQRSAELWPSFAAELHALTAVELGYTRCGSFVLALDDAERLEGDWLDGPTVRALEPGVTAECVGAVQLPADAQVDPRRVVDALVAALGWSVRTNADVVALEANAVVLADGSRVAAERIVLAAGAWTARRLARALPIRPVKGQTVRLRGPSPATRIIRSGHVYVVPRASGETVVGATVEEAGFDTTATTGATEALLREATRAVPSIAELEFVEAVASLRPGTPDGSPLLGEWGEEGLLVAGGHHRNGILLAPVTAEIVAALLADEEPPPEAVPFAPDRFG